MLKTPTIRGIPRTGQTTIWYTGDDGTNRTGWADTPRFLTAGTNLVIDRHTGLMWVANYALIPSIASGLAWTAAIDACAALSYAGYTGWRLPSIFELFTLMDMSRNDVMLPPPFVLGGSEQVWSATTRQFSNTFAYIIQVTATISQPVLTAGKGLVKYVLPCRSLYP